MKTDSNLFLGLFIGVIFIAFIYYLNGDNNPNQNFGNIGYDVTNESQVPIQPPEEDNRQQDDVRGDLVNDLISQYSVENRPMEGGTGSFAGFNPNADVNGAFNNYGKKRQINTRKMEEPYPVDKFDQRVPSYMKNKMMTINQAGSDSDNRDFEHRNQPFTKRTHSDVEDLFDVQKMLPQEDEDWFDITPLKTTKKIKGTHLIHPKVHMGVNTVSSSLRNGSHDIRGDIVNPKLHTGPWLQSTIEPDTNIKGICNPI